MPFAAREDRATYEKQYRKYHPDWERNKKATWRNSLVVKEREKKWKVDVLTYYGDNRLVCVRCGFEDIRALTIDHINNNGYKHRKALGLSGKGFYYWLKRQGYPDGYQTLCMNCQFIKRDETGTGNHYGKGGV